MTNTFIQIGEQRINMAQVQRYEPTEIGLTGEKHKIAIYFSFSATISVSFPTSKARENALKRFDEAFCMKTFWGDGKA